MFASAFVTAATYGSIRDVTCSTTYIGPTSNFSGVLLIGFTPYSISDWMLEKSAVSDAR